MISYAAVDRIEEDAFIVCEVELVELEKSHLMDDWDKEIKIMDFPKENALMEISETIHTNDVLVVEHDGESIIHILYKDDEEKQRRLS